MDDFSTLVSQTKGKLEKANDPYAQQVRRTVRAVLGFETDVRQNRGMGGTVQDFQNILEQARVAQKTKGFDKKAKLTIPAKSKINQKNSKNAVAGLKAQLTPILQNLSAKSGDFEVSDYYRPAPQAPTAEALAQQNPPEPTSPYVPADASSITGSVGSSTVTASTVPLSRDRTSSFASSTASPMQPPPPRTQTAEQTASTLAGEGAGALPTATATVTLNAQAQAKTDGVPAGGPSNDAGEDDFDNASLAGDDEQEDKPTVNPEAGDTSTATGLKTAGGTTNPIGATADDIAAARAQVAESARAEEAQARVAGTRPDIDPKRRTELEEALDYVPVRPEVRTQEDEQKFFIARSVAEELGIPPDAPAYPKDRSREGNTHADYFIDAMEAKGTSFFQLYKEGDYGYTVMGLEAGDTYNLNEETGEVYVAKRVPNITGQRRGRDDEDVGNRGGEKVRAVGGGEPNVTEEYKQAVLQAYLREGSVYLKNLIAQGQWIAENARKVTANVYGAPPGAPRGQEDERRYQELVAQVNRITQQAQARVERVAREQAEGGAEMPLPGVFNFYNFGAQNSFEALNQLIQGYSVNIPNAVERQAFIASMEQGEREDAREEARQAQVPAEEMRQRNAQQEQELKEDRARAQEPQQIPDPVDVDIDIASLSLGDAGSVPSTQQLGDAMTQDRAKESMERRHRESLSVQQLKQEIEALHSVYDSLIPEFKKGDHQRQKASAMASGRPEALREHLSNMMASVRRYYTQGGMRVGVIISREAFMGMSGGQAGAGMSVPATSQQKGIEITKHGQSKFRPGVRNEQVMRGGINTKKTLDNFIPKVDPQTRRPQRPHAQLNRFDSAHPSVELPRRTRPYDIILKTKSK